MYRVHLNEFEGPLDLLLFFIKRDELDIYDIPIAQIADEFLEYVRVLEQIDLDGVGDFVYMAALLISIKAQMLLPSPPVDEMGEPIDPRRELVERLLEYIRYKEASQLLDDRHAARGEQFSRGIASSERRQFEEETEMRLNVSMFDLVSALRRILTEASEEPHHEVTRFEYSIEEQQVYILEQVPEKTRRSFHSLVEGRTKSFVIATFLAVLELARQMEIRIQISKRLTDFFVVRQVSDPQPSGDGMAGPVLPEEA